jgi:hypothetical protein
MAEYFYSCLFIFVMPNSTQLKVISLQGPKKSDEFICYGCLIHRSLLVVIILYTAPNEKNILLFQQSLRRAIIR